MTINYQFGDVDAHGAMIRAQAASLEAEHQAIVRRRFGGLPGVHYPVGP
ncbi:putative esat-6 like protein [Mycobacterium tuberculosis]|nr:putative esat-6 like protein [Mycobacterium tuberculosis]